MTEQGVDYSGARFTVAQLKAAGVAAVGRYLTGPYAITKAELDEYVAGGIATWFILEVGINDVAGGIAEGQLRATQANSALTALGLPVSQPVYFTIDEDLTNPAEAVPYYQGIASVRAPLTNGDYAEGAVAQLLTNDGLVGYNWQSESTAFNGNAVTLPITDIQQSVDGAPLPDTDEDHILKTDFGQYPRPNALPGGIAMSDIPGAVASALTASGNGSWVVTNTGNVYTSGDAQEYGTLFTAGVKNVTNIVGIFRSWGGNGYFLLGSDGGVFAFGDAKEATNPAASYPGLPASDRQGERSFGAGGLVVNWGGAGYTLIALDNTRYNFT